jgi:hypothetical protein
MDHVRNVKGEMGGYFLLCDGNIYLLFRKVKHIVPWYEVTREFGLSSFGKLIRFYV